MMFRSVNNAFLAKRAFNTITQIYESKAPKELIQNKTLNFRLIHCFTKSLSSKLNNKSEEIDTENNTKLEEHTNNKEGVEKHNERGVAVKEEKDKYLEEKPIEPEPLPKKKFFNVYVGDPQVARAVYGLREKPSREVMEFRRTDCSRDKETFLNVIEAFKEKTGSARHNAAGFVSGAVKEMKAHGVHRDLESYRALISIFPEGKYIAKNMLMADMMYAPVHQECVLTLLDYMSRNGVMPDVEFGLKLLRIFGKHAHVCRKFYRMMYWKPKYRNANPYMDRPVSDFWALAETMPLSEYNVYMANIVLRRMCVDRETVITKMEIEEEGEPEPTFILSAQSPTQKRLLEQQPEDQPLVVEGGFYVWIAGRCFTYFQLHGAVTPIYKHFSENLPKQAELDFDFTKMFWGEEEIQEFSQVPSVPPSVHEQAQGTIMSIVMTRTSSAESVSAWLRWLEHDNPRLASLPVLFQMRTPEEGQPVWNGDNEVRDDEEMARLFPDFAENSRKPKNVNKAESGQTVSQGDNRR